jgi:protein-S-isoprenylcysteine O-methyltransferase Ste14
MIHLQTFSLPNTLFYVANALWLLEFIFFRNQKNRSDFTEKISFWFLTLMIGLMILLTIILSRNGNGSYQLTSVYPFMQWLSLGFYGLGLYLRYQGSYALGRNFTRHVKVSKTMTLISHGPYRYWRHPLYLGLGLIVFAFPIFVGNWLSLIIVGPLLFLGLLWRMQVEETALIRLHPDYRGWRKNRYWIIPYIF